MTGQSAYGALKRMIEEGGGGSTPQGISAGFVVKGGSFPTTRLDGTPLQNEDYVKASGNPTDFPYTIQGKTFNQSNQKAYYDKQHNDWVVDAGVIIESSELVITDPTNESIFGDATNQNIINKELIERYKDVFKDTTYPDLDAITEDKIIKRVYHQTTKTSARKAGFYIYDFSIHKWVAFGNGGISFKQLKGKLEDGAIGIYDEDNNKLTMQKIKELYNAPDYFIYLEYLNIIFLPSARYLETDNAFEFDGHFQENKKVYVCRVIINNENVVAYSQIEVENVENKVEDFPDDLSDEEKQKFYLNLAGAEAYGDKILKIKEHTELNTIDKTVAGAINENKERIDTLEVRPDVVDIVQCYDRGTDETKTDIVHYDKSKIFENDIVKVLIDETHDGKVSYFKLNIGGEEKSFIYVGSDKPIETDNTTINKNENGQLQVKDESITNDKLDPANKVGLLANLETEKKDTVVDAVNENKLRIDVLDGVPNVVDVVECYDRGDDETKTDIVHYNLAILKERNLVKVLNDEGHENHKTFYTTIQKPESKKWENKVWLGFTTIYGNKIWEKDGILYHSHGNYTHYLDGDEWKIYNWDSDGFQYPSGATLINGIYYTFSNNKAYYLDGNKWIPANFTGVIPTFVDYIWEHNGVYYYSDNGVNAYLDGIEWKPIMWNANIKYGFNIWHKDDVTYYSDGSNHYYLDSDMQWKTKVWSGSQNLIGQSVWIRNGIYHCDTTLTHIYLDGDEWKTMEWEGTLIPWLGAYIYKYKGFCYISNGGVCYQIEESSGNQLIYKYTEPEPEVKSNPTYSLERLGDYLYKTTYDTIAPFKVLDDSIGACTVFIRDGLMHRNLDLTYDNAATFIVKTKNFDGIAYLSGLDDGTLNDNAEKIEQLPYYLKDGVNRDGIRVAVLVLYNDWSYDGAGRKDKDILQFPYFVLENLHKMSDINDVLADYVANIKISETQGTEGLLRHFIITDGTTTYAVEPPMSATGSYVIIDITSNPKETNFRWVDRKIVSRTDSDIQTRPNGIERWNEIETGAELKDLRFTKCYEEPNRLSEFIGINETTKNSSDEELTTIYNTAHTEYLNRIRDGKTWHTRYSVVYDTNGIVSLFSQENYDKNYITQSGDSGELEKKQDKIDDNLTTEDKTVVGGINENKNEIDKINARPQVIDVVECYDRGTDTGKTDIVHYNRDILKLNDTIKVLSDEKYNDNRAYYRYKKSAGSKKWDFKDWNITTVDDYSYVWKKDGVYHYSNGDKQYYLDTDLQWKIKNWDNDEIWFIDGRNIWEKDGIYYLSSGTDQYYLDDNTWKPMTWRGSYSSIEGWYIWKNNGTYYFSNGASHYYLDGDEWKPMTWDGYTAFEKHDLWYKDGVWYLSQGSVEYYLDGTTWKPMVWENAPDNLMGAMIFEKDGVYYFSVNMVGLKAQYYLDGITWKPMTWEGTYKPNGHHIFKFENMYYSIDMATFIPVPICIEGGYVDLVYLYEEVNDTSGVGVTLPSTGKINDKFFLTTDYTTESKTYVRGVYTHNGTEWILLANSSEGEIDEKIAEAKAEIQEIVDSMKPKDYGDTFKNITFNKNNLNVSVATIKAYLGFLSLKIEAQLKTNITNKKSDDTILCELPALPNGYVYPTNSYIKITQPSGQMSCEENRHDFYDSDGAYYVRPDIANGVTFIVDNYVLIEGAKDASGNPILLVQQQTNANGDPLFDMSGKPICLLENDIAKKTIVQGRTDNPKIYTLTWSVGDGYKFVGSYVDSEGQTVTGRFYQLNEVNINIDTTYLYYANLLEKMYNVIGSDTSFFVDADGDICSIVLVESEASKVLKRISTNMIANKYGMSGTYTITKVPQEEMTREVLGTITNNKLYISGEYTVKGFDIVSVR